MTAMRNLNLSALMRNRLFKIGAGLATLAAVFLSSAVAQQPAMKTLHGHVPAVVSSLQANGWVAGTNSLDLAIGLPLRNQAALSNLLQQIYDPASPNYHHYLTMDEFTAQFGPTAEDYQKVINFARAGGLTVTGTHQNRMLLDVAGSAADVGRAFHVSLRTYHHPTENRDFFAPDTEPSVSSTLPVQDISGLDNYRRPHANFKLKPAIAPTSAAAGVNGIAKPDALNGSGPSGTYMGNDFRNAYVPGTSLDGSGQTIALVQFDGYLASDIAQYESLAGRPNVTLQNVLLDGFSGVPTGNGGEVEVSLDIEMVISMAPGLSKVIVYEGNPYNFHPNDVLNRIASDNAARQISCSWGWTGGPTATTDQIFRQMAVQGQTFFVASGDADAYPAGTVDSPFGFGTPSDSAYLTSVGGTTLRMQGTGVSYASETVWNWDIRYGSVYDGVGSSGGISTYYPIPTWQTNINMTIPKGSTTFRNFPDVALTADDVFVIADGGLRYIGVGGTSCASPLWAGFIALVNQMAANNGHAAVGFVNPALYAIATGPNYTSCFHDITTDNNEWSGSPNLFRATSGYDLCTGLGTPNGNNLIVALAATVNTITHFSPPTPPYGSTLTALNGANPNGIWALYELSDGVFDSGVITNGWILALTTANPVGAAADNAITMTASPVFPGIVPIGGNGTYILTVINYGPSVSSNVLVSDTFPLGAPLVSSNVPPGTTLSRSGNQLLWNIGTLNTNAGATLTLTVQAVSGVNLYNTAIVSANTPDPNPSDDFASYTISSGVIPPPQFSGAATASGGKFVFSVISGPNQTNVIQSSTNLISWLSIYTNVGPFTFTNTIVPGYPVQFYRDLILGP
jgi:uncharacterized repeat protein (TIGR01451 family)